eukprot:gnl/TRDRNA2_/TRDRNA2_152012_c1_seq1.p1 gnl/TRDRNA2_/TRDRNA2_152012_c1~~gnl/TRDRNA2_/TRDRNA2_152012_c1_seq1.p1  ORF type:complete len:226 (-),score=37.64 gnl/TRDRNA2_/TRDRNA2_152012_c1_seq1:184-837(-)
MATLRKFLSQNRISNNLTLRVQRSAKHAIAGDLTEDAVELLHIVCEPLRIEMHFEMYGSILRHHPFFLEFLTEAPDVMRRICHYAMSTLLLSRGDLLFSKGEVPTEPKMYFMWKGSVEYDCPWNDDSLLHPTDWVAEPTLWTQWQHRGTLTAVGDAKLAVLDAKTFQQIAVKRSRAKDCRSFNPKVYAADFVDSLCMMEKNDQIITDLTATVGPRAG